MNRESIESRTALSDPVRMPSGLTDPSPFETLSSVEPIGGERLVLRDMLTTFERDLIVMVLLAADGNQRRAAQALGVLPTTLQEKLKRFGLIDQRPGRSRRGERERVQSDPVTPDETHTQPQAEDQE